MREEPIIVLYDGVCVMCSSLVRFLVKRDHAKRLLFAPLQSDEAGQLLARFGQPGVEAPDSLLVLEAGKWYDRSSGALRIARCLRGGWRLCGVFTLVPRTVRDAVYRFVAARRFRWFGRHDACQLPDAELRSRLLTKEMVGKLG